jgi:hypothetical protein
MALTPGGRLGAYEILAALGAGGMGDAHLKILPELFALDPERTARFEREAKTLAAFSEGPRIARPRQFA